MTESAEEKSEDWLSQARTLRSQNLWHALLRLSQILKSVCFSPKPC